MCGLKGQSIAALMFLNSSPVKLMTPRDHVQSEWMQRYTRLLEMALTGSLIDEAGRCNGVRSLQPGKCLAL
jgi:hypothetical protein